MFGVLQHNLDKKCFCFPLSLTARKKIIFCNTGYNHAKFIVNKLAFCQLSILKG
jgi:hypothetical protein